MCILKVTVNLIYEYNSTRYSTPVNWCNYYIHKSYICEIAWIWTSHCAWCLNSVKIQYKYQAAILGTKNPHELLGLTAYVLKQSILSKTLSRGEICVAPPVATPKIHN